MSSKLETKAKKVCCVINFKDDDHMDLIKDRLSRFAQRGFIYYAILHDKDFDDNGVMKTKHYHLVLCGNYSTRLSTWLNAIRDSLEVDLNQVSVQSCNDLFYSVQYLIHQNDDNKTQYLREDIISNDSEESILSMLSKEKPFDITIGSLQNLYYLCNGDRLMMMDRIGIGRFQSMRSTIIDIWNIFDKKKLENLMVQGAIDTLEENKE